MQGLFGPLKEDSDYRHVIDSINKNKYPIQISGCVDTQNVHFIQAVSNEQKCNNVIITLDEQNAARMAEDMRIYDKNVFVYPAKDMMFFSADIHGNMILGERLRFIKCLLEGGKFTLITTMEGLFDRLVPIELIRENILSYKCGDIVDVDILSRKLQNMGYQRVNQVDMTGQFAIRGSIIDLFPLTEEVPVRIDLWDDEIDSIRSFDPESQRSVENMEEVQIYPASEYIMDIERLENGVEKIRTESKKYEEALRNQMKTEEAHRIKSIVNEFAEQITEYGGQGAIDSYVPYFFDETVSLLDYFDENTLIWMDEPRHIQEKNATFTKEFQENMKHRLEKGYILPGQTNMMFGYDEIFSKICGKKILFMTRLEQLIKDTSIEEKVYINTRNINSYNGNFELLVKDLEHFRKNNYKVVILTGSTSRAMRMADDIRGYDLTAVYSDMKDKELQNGEIVVSYGNIHKGFEYPYLKLVVISESDIFGKEKKKRKKKKKYYTGDRIGNFAELNIGDYVVHENHGLGIYKGIEKIEVDKVTKDYIKIEYAEGGNLYVLATQLDVIQKYAGSDAKQPKLNKLGTKEWGKTKSRVRGAVKDMAEELVKLYSARQNEMGFQCGPDTVWQKEFEELFPYEETDDQLQAIEDTKADMESTKIMDRLVCGDVGYGKTEIAIRAAFKAVQEGKQVAFLVPTTILAQQHFNTFSSRMKDFAVNVDMLSRFRTPAQQKKALENTKKGMVDVLIGTHRLLSKDVEFKDLGLLIVDEEQRFGVAHKEKIKQLKQDVDVLTLSATPIPRTLHMSLVGIRDMSVLEEPPVDRLPIQTYIMEYDEEMVREAINRELSRNGQVYYVYNRVHNIDEIAARVAKLVPEANVAFVHGQMSERTMEKIMYDFIQGEIDVLVATTIIETGLDISNANTMIVHDADNMGLAQLYQLRGRIGRSNRTSYAFLMYRRNKVLREVAEKRLQAIREFTELGSGIKIAMRDLEIRGAGNVLGAEQHGHMAAVGYDLYCKMLNEAVQIYKGEKQYEDFETSIDINIDAFIPNSYIKNEYQKLSIYKRVASIENEEEYSDMQDELMDRFGEMPKAVMNLLLVALIKSRAHKLFITEISEEKKTLIMKMHSKAPVKVDNIPALLEKYKYKIKFVNGSEPEFHYYLKENIKDGKTFRNGVGEALDIIEEFYL